MNARLARTSLLLPAIAIGMLPTTGIGLWLIAPLIMNHALYIMGVSGLLNFPRGEALGTTLRLRTVPVVLVLALLTLPGMLMIGVPALMIRGGAGGAFFAITAVTVTLYLALTLPFWFTYPLTASWRRALGRYTGVLSPASRSAMAATSHSMKSAGGMLLALPIPLAFWSLCGMLWWILDGQHDPTARFHATLAYALVAAPAVHIAIVAYSRLIFGSLDQTAKPERGEAPLEKPIVALRAPNTKDPQRALIEAVVARQMTSVERLMELGARPDGSILDADGNRLTALVEAAKNGDSIITRMLLTAGADANLKAGALRPLHAAASAGDASTVQLLLEGGAQPSVADPSGRTALHIAAKRNASDIIDILGGYRANVEAVDRRHLTPLGLACHEGHWDAATALLEIGADLHTDDGHLPLGEVAALAEDGAHGAELLMERGADPGRPGRLGRTPLMAAGLANNAKIADMLLRAGADIDGRDQFGVTALMEAARAGADSVLENMIFWNPSTEFHDKTGRTALMVAIASRKAKASTVRLLLQMGADPLAIGAEGSSAIELAAKSGRSELQKILQQAAESRGTTQVSPAKKSRHVQQRAAAAEIVPDKPPTNPGIEPELPPSPAPVAATISQPRVATKPEQSEPALVVSRGLVKDVGSRLAEAAGADDLAECAQILDEYEQLPDATLRVAFLEAAAAGANLVPGVLLDAGLDPNDQSGGGRPLLSLASHLSPPPLGTLQALIERGAMIEPSSDREASPLIAWLRNTPSALNGSVEPDDDSQRSLTALVVAAGAAGLDADARDSEGRLALSWALELHSSNVIEALLQAGADPNKVGIGGDTPLMEACRSTRADAANLVRQLARHGGDPHLKSGNDTSAFRVAMQSGNQTLLTFLMAGSSVRSDESAALIAAAKEGNVQRVTQLLDAGMEIDGRDAKGRTSLYHAAAHGHYRLAEKLVRDGAAVDAVADDGSTALGAAARDGHAELVQLLQLAGADVGHPQITNQTPLGAAAQAWDSGMVALLLKLGAQPNDRDGIESTPLMAAAKSALELPASSKADATIRVLLDAGANVNAVNDDQQTALMLLAGIRSNRLDASSERGVVDLMGLLVAAGANVNAHDVSGWSSLHAAAALGNAHLIEALINAGANPKAVDINGNSPADIARERGHEAVAAALDELSQPRRASH